MTRETETRGARGQEREEATTPLMPCRHCAPVDALCFWMGTGRWGSKRRGQGLQRDGDCSGKALDIARWRGDKRTAREKKTEALEREKRHAKTVVTTMTGKEGTREVAASCLVTSPCIIEAKVVDGSTKGAKEMNEGSSEVCCISFV